MKREDRRPHVAGWDDCDVGNYLRGLFKHDGLLEYVMRAIKNNSDKCDYFPDQELAEVSEDQASRVIGIIEDKLRTDLFEMAQEFDASIEKNNAYIDGLLDAAGIPAFEED